MSRPTSALTASGDAVLCILDIAGTGAARLWPVLERAFAPEERAFVYEQQPGLAARTSEAFRSMAASDLAGLRLVMGSSCYGVHRQLPAKVVYVALVRDPLERVVALHEDFARRLPADRPALSLESFVFGQQRLEVDNGQVRAIAGRRLVAWGETYPSLLSEAVAHIDGEFAALLVASDPGRSVAALAAAAGRELEGAAEALAVPAVDISTVEAHLAARIRALNGLDARLFDLARARLSATVAA
jgi:hypothetical protein